MRNKFPMEVPHGLHAIHGKISLDRLSDNDFGKARGEESD
jgi:hypothetical protein